MELDIGNIFTLATFISGGLHPGNEITVRMKSMTGAGGAFCGAFAVMG